MCSDGRVRRGRTPSGWDGRRSPLLCDGWRSLRGPGGLRAALLASHHTSRPAGREGDSSAVESCLASLASLASSLCWLAEYFVVSDGHRVGLRHGGGLDWLQPTVGGGGQGGGGGLDHHLSQGWGRVGPSERENINIVLFVNHWTGLTRDM